MTDGVISAASSAEARSWIGRSINFLGKSRSNGSGTGAGANIARMPPGSMSRASGGEMVWRRASPIPGMAFGELSNHVQPGGQKVVAREQDEAAHEGWC